jgi:hypothetical protein
MDGLFTSCMKFWQDCETFMRFYLFYLQQIVTAEL